MRTALALMLVIPSTLAFAGPGKSGSVIGNWNVLLTNRLPADAIFRTNGTMEFDAANPNAKTMKIIMMAKYRIKGSTMFMTFTGVDFKNTPASAKSQEGAMKAALRKQLEVGTEKQAVMKWSSADAFIMTSSEGKVTTFKRAGKRK